MSDKCILVAEDNPVIRSLTVSSLTPEGYDLLEASDGLEALTISEGHPGKIDLLITNVNMPLMTGHDLARSIKKSRPDICVLIVSGEHESDFPAAAIYHSDALLKPVRPEHLRSKVKELLGLCPKA